MPAKPPPKNEPRDFRLQEMFFSTTDRKGVIRSGNEVFVRVSGYALDELLGQPHNIIRHPDMPRAVFRRLWQQLHDGRAIAAYVKNLARDGCYYWVVALITPLDGGFLSIRFKPSSPLLAKVEKLYAAMRAAEREPGDKGGLARVGMDAADRVLAEALAAEGFADYDHFMWAMVHAEMKSRAAGLRAGAARNGAETPAGASAALRAIHQAGTTACGAIDRLYARLDELAGFSRQLTDKSAYVTNLTRDIRFVALSTSIKAARLGEAGSGLGVIAQFLSDSSGRTAGDVQRLTARIGDITDELHAVIFNLAGARLQIEMVLEFCLELMRGAADAAGAGRPVMITDLERAFAATLTEATKLLNSLGQHLHELNAEAEDLRKTMLMLQVAQVCGLVETSRIHSDQTVSAIFDEVRAQVGRTAIELTELGGITQRFAQLIHDAPEIEREAESAVSRMRTQVAALAAAAPAASAGDRQADADGRAPAGLALDGEVAPGALHDPACEHQAQA